ncbi:MAG: hypothetical protein HQ559_00940, partial [Lentisphaerae bacterium]|nr:hypothetical protein [Lentisphaerota bacterium]
VDDVEAIRAALGDADHDAHRIAEEGIRAELLETETDEDGLEKPSIDVAEVGTQLKELGKVADRYADEFKAAKEADDRFRAMREALAELKEVVEEVDEADEAFELAAEPYEDVFDTIDRVDRAALSDAERERFDELAEALDTSDPLQKAGVLGDMAAALENPQSRLKQFLEDKVAEMDSDPSLQEADKNLMQARQEAARKASELKGKFAAWGSINAEQAEEALERISEEAMKDVPGPLDVADPIADVSQALDRMAPPVPQPVPLEGESFDAAAKASALGNVDAVEKADLGDYDGAAESMERMAERMGDGPDADLARQAADAFERAQEARTAELPAPLANAIRQAEPLAPQMRPGAARELARAADAARGGDYPRASEHLSQAAQGAPGQAKPRLDELGKQIAQAGQQQAEREEALPEQVRDALREIAELEPKTDPVARAALNEAAEKILDRDFDEAAKDLAAASLALPDEQRQTAMDAAGRLANQQPLRPAAGMEGTRPAEGMAEAQPAVGEERSSGEDPSAPDPESPAERFEEVMDRAPELAAAADPEMDWNARRGLMEGGAHALFHPEAESWIPEAAAAAAAEDFQEAAELASGPVADRFEQAAEAARVPPIPAADSADPVGDGPVVPPTLADPRRPLSKKEEALLGRMAARDRGGLVDEARKEVVEAKQELEKLRQSVQEKKEDPGAAGDVAKSLETLADSVDELEARRAALGEDDYAAHRVMEEELRPAIRPAAGTEEPAEDSATDPVLKAIEDLDRELGKVDQALETEAAKVVAQEEREEKLEELDRALRAVEAADVALARAAEPYAEAFDVPSRVNRATLSPTELEKFDKMTNGFEEASALEKAEKMAEMAGALEDPETRLAEFLSGKAEEVRNDARLKKADE